MEHRKKKEVGIRWIAMGLWLLSAGCGEPVFENAGSPKGLAEDREACAMELEKGPTALAYRHNPTAHPDFANQIFIEMNRCIERKGWKQVKSQQEQPQVRETSPQLAQTHQSAPRSDPRASDNTAGDEWPENGSETK